MQTILEILRKAGGWHHGLYLKIDNPPYMELVIEATDESGPCGFLRSFLIENLGTHGIHIDRNVQRSRKTDGIVREGCKELIQCQKA